jgi:hypothetical protein
MEMVCGFAPNKLNCEFKPAFRKLHNQIRPLRAELEFAAPFQIVA